jgi:sRNA-binding carbon storage regulator CsrA
MMDAAAAAMNGDAIDVTIVPHDDDMVEVAVNLPVVISNFQLETRFGFQKHCRLCLDPKFD